MVVFTRSLGCCVAGLTATDQFSLIDVFIGFIFIFTISVIPIIPIIIIVIIFIFSSLFSFSPLPFLLFFLPSLSSFHLAVSPHSTNTSIPVFFCMYRAYLGYFLFWGDRSDYPFPLLYFSVSFLILFHHVCPNTLFPIFCKA